MHHVYGKRGKTAVNKNVLILDTFTGKKNKPVSFFVVVAIIREKTTTKTPNRLLTSSEFLRTLSS